MGVSATRARPHAESHGARRQAARGTIRRAVALVWAAPLLWVLCTVIAQAGVVARVDLSSQRMTVSVNGVPRYNWPVSTARRGYVTPTGTYRPQRLYRSYYSKKYYNSPMPHAVFFRGGYAIHGSYAVNQLGAPASHGCIRLHPGNAATLYGLIQSYGPQNTLIQITR
ncbi:L,D-transpeptidase [Xanthobacter agilis]|uniref:L,D-transpeptidase n=1 Tax=Xanthobacter agilis TaxID=47492 RepID=UPI0037283B25